MAVIKAVPGQVLTFNTADTTLKEGDFVVVSGDMTVSKAGAGAEADGIVVVPYEMGLVSVLMNKPVVEVTAGGAISAGADVEINASQQVVTKSTGVKVGIALKATTGAGQKTWVALTL